MGLSPMRVLNHVITHGEYCLYCRSTKVFDLPHAPLYYHGEGKVKQGKGCTDCDKRWTDVYILNNVEEREL